LRDENSLWEKKGSKMMKPFRRLPKRIRFGLVVIGLNIVIFTLFRLIFWALFRSTAPEPSGSEFLWALYLGFRFDLRLSLLICLPVLALSWIPGLNLVRSSVAKWIWLVYFAAMAAFLILTYFVDLAHYDYLHDRLNARAIEHILSPVIALQFIWETYPVVPGLLVLVLLSIGYGWVVKRLAFRELEDGGHPLPKWPRVATVGVALILFGLGIHGKLSQYPLRWSEAYFSTNPLVTALALNPVLFFFDTREYKTDPFDKEEVRKHYDLIADLLEVDDPDPATLNFSRYVRPEEKLPGRPNIVLILLESFAGFKVGALGNALNPTPHFDSIARKSVFFTNFFVNRPPTARAVFTAMFGIPDIHSPHSASRNPIIVRQHTIVNALKGYEKMYFLGGSANWGNIRGVLAHNIDGLEIYEEGDFSYLPDDAWGISDLHLFEEANRVFRVRDKPFFALIHTAGNHRPYTIPKDKGDFEEVEVDEAKLEENGFDSLKAYNGIRFLDYSLGHFFRLASKEDYFKRTIFCMYADHGTVANQEIPWDKLTLTSHHVPFAIYAPGYFSEGRTIDTTGSLVDVLPTVLGLIGVPYLNKTLGRDLLVERPKDKHIAFIDSISTGLLDDEFFLLIDPRGVQRLYRYRSDSPLEDVRDEYPERGAEMARLQEAIRETSRYLLYHNPPANLPVSSE
jgi:phosphoglycerol transferase MdoB-like AlkP superfamily enzyme